MLSKLLTLLCFLVIGRANATPALQEMISVKTSVQWQKLYLTQSSELTRGQCKEELSLKMIPSSCFDAELLDSTVEAFLNRQCKEVAESIENLEVIVKSVRSPSLSHSCRKALNDRGKILAYKMEATRPAQAFDFFSSQVGPKFEKAVRHAQSAPVQSN